MRRILVPLDGTAFAAAILPDARRLAGSDGVLILLNEVRRVPPWDAARPSEERAEVEASREYLEGIANGLRSEQVQVETKTLVAHGPGQGIDDATTMARADMVAVATHFQGTPERLPQGSTAWRALAHSRVPVLIRHLADVNVAPRSPEPHQRRIMVPLDGSALAEKALPLARELADEWNASIWLVHVVSHYPITDFARTETDPDAVTDDVAYRSGQRYLDRIASGLGPHVQTRVLLGSPADELATATATWAISDIVLCSHGRTGMARAIPGSVAGSLIHRLDLPVIVVPARANETHESHRAGRRRTLGPVGGR